MILKQYDFLVIRRARLLPVKTPAKLLPAMEVPKHVVASILISALVWWVLRSAAAAAACFLVGVLIDLDHLFDHLYHHRGRLNLRRFFRAFRIEIMENIFVFLHSWEFVILWLALLLTVPEARQPVALGLFIGFASHLLLDNLFNRHSRWAYFLLFRLRHGFAGKYYYGAREYRSRIKHVRRLTRQS
ncbi:MAG: hypothetical protein HYV35_00565 [Lentisphaerae bacterium]|nr:hypothetical protein [Lentisphaerota bacterium]